MDLFAGNLAALEDRSPRVAALVRVVPPDAEFTIGEASDGRPIVERGGRPLDSRRAPAESARRQAQATPADSVAVVGLGTGYFLDAVLESGRPVAALIESSARSLAAAMRARDLRSALRRVPVLLAETIADPVEMTCLKAKVPSLAVHGACLAVDAQLREIVERWPHVEIPSRAPRVLVVGPILGGCVEAARSTAVAAEAVGADVKFLDGAPFARGWQAFASMGLSGGPVERLQATYAAAVGDGVLALAASWEPDLVLALARAPLGVAHLQSLRRARVRAAFWLLEDGRALPHWKGIAPACDAFFAIHAGAFLDQVRSAGAPKAVYLPAACDRRRHVPVVLTDAERARFASDVSFAGRPCLNRRRVAFALNGFALRLWGEGWEQSELRRSAADGGARFSVDEMVRIFAASKINLNLHSAAHVDGLDPEPDYVNARTFAIAACGAFGLVDHRTPLPSLFADDEIAEFCTVAQLREQVAHYLAHPEERDAIAARGRARALAEHTFEHRVTRILRETLPPALVAGALLGLKRETLHAAIERVGQAPAMSSEEALLRALAEIERPVRR